MYYRYIVAITSGLFLGLIISYKLDFSTEIFFVSLILIFINFLIYKFQKRSFGVYKSFVPILVLVFFIGTALGILLGQYDLSYDLEKKNNFQNYISQKNDFEGMVSNVSISQSSQKFILNVNDETEIFKIKIITGLFPKYNSGDMISVSGKVSDGDVVLPDITQSKKSFNVKDKDDLLDIDGEMAFPKIKFVSESVSGNVFSKLENTKNNFLNILEKDIPLDAAALSAGTTLGDSSLFTKEDINAFRVSGLSHIIVLSGFNITILIFVLIYIFSLFRLRLFWRVTLSIFSIIFFILFVGGGPSLVRAGIMGGVLLIASLFGRQYIAKQALFVSAFFMMIANPKIALYDVSFHLSFLATFGILYLVPIFDNYRFFQKDKNDKIEYNLSENKSEKDKNKFSKKIWDSILEILKVTLAVQIMVLPYIMFVFGKVSIFSLIANILVVPLVPVIMLLSVLILFFSFFANFISIFLGWVSYLFCEYIFIIARFIFTLPFSQVENYISGLTLFLLYLILFLFIYFENFRQKINSYLNS
ncbi:MAG: ComEC/Rec2 family competence protein [Candidatus Paceibacterota bacterium]